MSIEIHYRGKVSILGVPFMCVMVYMIAHLGSMKEEWFSRLFMNVELQFCGWALSRNIPNSNQEKVFESTIILGISINIAV